ncbi:ATP-binding protein [Plantibacter sp. RU18]|uniref:ATP-binding protein n=1 Tax=Plantibacter sp. RU18 TaxID=3158143 RepID=UPI003D36F2CE
MESLDLEPGAVAGDARLVRLLADNLLGNAEQAFALTEPFVRLHGRAAVERDRDRGHGLGLAIVAAIARRHRAELRLEPRASGGLEVSVIFPAWTAP